LTLPVPLQWGQATVHKFIGLVTGDRYLLERPPTPVAGHSQGHGRRAPRHRALVQSMPLGGRHVGRRRPQIPPELVVGGGQTMKKLFVFFWVGSVVFLGQKKRPAWHGPFSGLGWLLSVAHWTGLLVDCAYGQIRLQRVFGVPSPTIEFTQPNKLRRVSRPVMLAVSVWQRHAPHIH